jgi:hypothetical protein
MHPDERIAEDDVPGHPVQQLVSQGNPAELPFKGIANPMGNRLAVRAHDAMSLPAMCGNQQRQNSSNGKRHSE